MSRSLVQLLIIYLITALKELFDLQNISDDEIDGNRCHVLPYDLHKC